MGCADVAIEGPSTTTVTTTTTETTTINIHHYIELVSLYCILCGYV